jgi:RimJ/RimL family protein N-acetyltransferase
MLPVEIAAGILQLRPLAAGHAAQLLASLTDPGLQVASAIAARGDQTAAEATARFIAATQEWSDSECSWGVFDTAGTVLGGVSIFGIDTGQGSGQVGYWTLPPARGRGVATAALKATCSWAFGQLQLHRIELFHAVDNPASCVVAQRGGFTLEGELRQSYRYHDGVRRDEHLHARLATDPTP